MENEEKKIEESAEVTEEVVEETAEVVAEATEETATVSEETVEETVEEPEEEKKPKESWLKRFGRKIKEVTEKAILMVVSPFVFVGTVIGLIVTALSLLPCLLVGLIFHGKDTCKELKEIKAACSASEHDAVAAA